MLARLISDWIERKLRRRSGAVAHVMTKERPGLLFSAVPREARRACWSLFGWGVLLVLTWAMLLFTSFNTAEPGVRTPTLAAFLGATLILGILSISAAFLLAQGSMAGKVVAWIVIVPSLLLIPLGTIISIYAIIGMQGWEMREHYEAVLRRRRNAANSPAPQITAPVQPSPTIPAKTPPRPRRSGDNR